MLKDRADIVDAKGGLEHKDIQPAQGCIWLASVERWIDGTRIISVPATQKLSLLSKWRMPR